MYAQLHENFENFHCILLHGLRKVHSTQYALIRQLQKDSQSWAWGDFLLIQKYIYPKHMPLCLKISY